MRLRTFVLTLIAILALPGARVAGLIQPSAPTAAVSANPATVAPTGDDPAPNTPPPTTSPASDPVTFVPANPPGAITVVETITPPPPPTTIPVVPSSIWGIVHVRDGGVDVYNAPTDPTPALHLTPRTDFDTPRALLVVEQRSTWWKVRLQQRPNGATGWVRMKTSTSPRQPTRCMSACVTARCAGRAAPT